MEDFPNKMSSLGEVQRIIGLSLSKIQMGRNQRGGLPLHKNLLVATVLNKARDLYMQETMYMNYKMMTGQFNMGNLNGQAIGDVSGAAADKDDDEEYDEDSESDVEDEGDNTGSSASQACTSSMAAAMMMRAAAANSAMNNLSNSSESGQCETGQSSQCGDQMGQQMNLYYQQSQQVPMNEMGSNQGAGTSSQQAPSWGNMMPFLQMQQQYQQQQQQQQQQQHYNHNQQHQMAMAAQAAAFAAARAAAVTNNIRTAAAAANGNGSSGASVRSGSSSSSDEGFIDEPECDCDARNFGGASSSSSGNDGRVPFQYCYHCAPFHPSNGRGPTLVPAPASSVASSESMNPGDDQENRKQIDNVTIYDLDSKSTQNRLPCQEFSQESGPRGIKRRRRISSDAVTSSGQRPTPVKRRRHSEGGESFDSSLSLQISNQFTSSQGDQQTLMQQQRMLHPAFRASYPGSGESTNSCMMSGAQAPAMEIDQITSLVSIFSFGQQIMAAAAASNGQNCTNQDPVAESSSDEEDDEVEDRPAKKKKIDAKSSSQKKSGEDSDSESDTSSDSGHSSDDHDNSSTEDKSSTASDDKSETSDKADEPVSNPPVMTACSTQISATDSQSETTSPKPLTATV